MNTKFYSENLKGRGHLGHNIKKGLKENGYEGMEIHLAQGRVGFHKRWGIF
jgi:hypothetical protein